MDLPEAASFRAITGVDVHIKAVDIGANPIDGDPPYAPFMRSGRAEVVGFEPNEAALAELMAKKGPNEIYLPLAVGDGERHTLRLCMAPGMTSLLPPDPAVLSLFHGFAEWGEVKEIREVHTVRLDDVAETAGADFIKLDIQGAELMVLRNAERRLAGVSVLHVETLFVPMYAGQPMFSEVELFLRGQGFSFHRFFPLTTRLVRPLIYNNELYGGLSQVAWADSVFIRDISRLDRYTDDQLIKTAAILHDCYRSIDVVLHLLIAFGRRTGTDLTSAYLDGLRRHATL